MSDETLRAEGVDHVALVVRDRAKSKKWYSEMFGFEALDGGQNPDSPYIGNESTSRAWTAHCNEAITLFGEGEEMRDHVCVEDVAEVVRLCLLHRSAGILNVATGAAASFRDVAEMVAGHIDQPVPITPTPRQMPVTHRHFDITERLRAFPGLSLTPLEEGLARVHREEAEAR